MTSDQLKALPDSELKKLSHKLKVITFGELSALRSEFEKADFNAAPSPWLEYLDRVVEELIRRKATPAVERFI